MVAPTMRPHLLAPRALGSLFLLASASCAPTPPAVTPPAAHPSASAAPVEGEYGMIGILDVNLPPPAPPAKASPPAPPPAPPAPPLPSPPAPPYEILRPPPGSPLDQAAAQAERGEWAPARKTLAARMPALDAGARLDDAMAGHALLGRACDMLKDAACAAEHYGKVVALWSAPDAEQKLGAGAGDDAERSRRTTRAVTAAGEALFFAAERKRAAADAIVFPVYAGSGSREDVLAFVKREVAVWVKRKRPAIEEAEHAYLAVLKLRPSSPPRWTLAAMERTGRMWADFVREFRATPTPAEWKGAGPVPGAGGLTYEQLRAEYMKGISEASEPQQERARNTFRVCRDWGIKHAIADEHTRVCEAWLTANP